MKKRVLNLSILCLMSSSFNMFASDLSTSFVENPESVIDKAIFVSAAGISDIVAESGSSTNKLVSEVIEMLPDVEKALANTYAGNTYASKVINFGNYFGSFLSMVPKYAKEYMCEGLEKSANAKDAVLAAARNNPRIAAALGLCALGGVAYTGYNRFRRNAGANRVVQLLDEENRTIGVGAADGGADVQENHLLQPNDIDSLPELNLDTIIEENEDDLDQFRSSELSDELRAQIDSQIEAQNGDVNALVNGRRLLGRFSEGPNANLDAVKYLVENYGAEHLLPGDAERTLLIFPAAWGHPAIVDYLLNLGGFTAEDKMNAKNYAISGLNANNFNQATFDQLNELLS
jgi:hypothetical protein